MALNDFMNSDDLKKLGAVAGEKKLQPERPISPRSSSVTSKVIVSALSGKALMIFSFTLVTEEFVYALTFISSEANHMIGTGIPIFSVSGDVYY